MAKSSGSSGVSLTTLLTVLFIGLKLGKVISWSWFWVLSPTIFSVILLVIVVLIIYLKD